MLHTVCYIRFFTQGMQKLKQFLDLTISKRKGAMVGLRDVSRLPSLDENVDLWIQRSKWLLIGHFFEDFCCFSSIVIEISDESVVISNKYRGGLTPVSNGIFKFCANQAFLLHHAVLEVSTQSGEPPFFGARVKLLRGHFQNLSTDVQKLFQI